MPRQTILRTYAEWTALSATRSGSPIKSRAEIYPLLRTIPFSAVTDKSLGSIRPVEFDKWHSKSVQDLMANAPKLANQAGWAAKLVNVYLKTFAYVGDGGRENLRECLHPPIDGGLWAGVGKAFEGQQNILNDTHHVQRINQITTYAIYSRLIDGLRAVAAARDCSLIEVEQFWELE